uniref:Uncharacterized protein n=1 Tax=Guillardia theta (strain CCMP2712) TaxID=905079 RepID=A0A0C3UF41_GUITC
MLCQIEVTAPTVKIGNNYGGRITAQGGYAFYRLLADGLQNRVIIVTKLSVASVAAFTPPLAIYVQRSEPSTSARTLTTCSVQKNIDCVQPTLSPNCTCNGTFTGNWTAAAASSCAWPCDSPFSSDQGSLGQASYQGRTSVEAILVPGSVYYVAVACVPGVTLPVTFSVSFQTF